MLNLQRPMNFLIYSLTGWYLTAYPALAQGEKIAELDETREFVEIALIAISTLVAIYTLLLLVRGVAQIGGGTSGFSALFPSLFTSFIGVVPILLGGLIIGQLTPILITLIFILCAVFVATLMMALVHP